MRTMGALAVKRNKAILAVLLLGLLAACEDKDPILPGERFPVRTDLSASVPVEGEPGPFAPVLRPENQSLPIALPAAVANAEWSQRGGNARHLVQNIALSANPVRIWSVNIGAGNSRRARIAAAPVVAEGRVFTIDAVGRLTATSTGGGALWTRDLAPEGDRGADVSGGGLAYGGGRLFAVSGAGELIAIEPASGTFVWRQRLQSAVTGSPAVADGVVYVVGRDGAAWAVEAGNGRVRWQVTGTVGSTGVIGAAAPVVGDTAVVFPETSGELIANDKAEGARVWASAVIGRRLGRAYGGLTEVTGDPVIDGAVVYAGNASGRTVALEVATGNMIWTADEGALGPVVPVGGAVFLVNDEGELVRLDAATGAPVWSVPLPYFKRQGLQRREAIYSQFGPVMAGGRLLVASGDGVIRFFSPTDGALVGSVDLPGGAATPPAIAGGVLYVVSAKGQLHAFR